jgi:hypothetical protein
MKTKFDIKSMALGILLGAVAVFSIAAATREAAPTPGTPRYQVSGWAIGTESQRESGCYVIDTWTGEVWNQDGVKMDKLSETLRSRP